MVEKLKHCNRLITTSEPYWVQVEYYNPAKLYEWEKGVGLNLANEWYCEEACRHLAKTDVRLAVLCSDCARRGGLEW